jgi:hypothetical protein
MWLKLNENSDDDFGAFFFVLMAPAAGSIALWGVATAAGLRLCRIPGSVITIDWCIIFRRFYEKLRG